MNATAQWRTAHGPSCVSTTHARSGSPPLADVPRRGPVPKLLWADFLAIIIIVVVVVVVVVVV